MVPGAQDILGLAPSVARRAEQNHMACKTSLLRPSLRFLGFSPLSLTCRYGSSGMYLVLLLPLHTPLPPPPTIPGTWRGWFLKSCKSRVGPESEPPLMFAPHVPHSCHPPLSSGLATQACLPCSSWRKHFISLISLIPTHWKELWITTYSCVKDQIQLERESFYLFGFWPDHPSVMLLLLLLLPMLKIQKSLSEKNSHF